MSKLTIVRHGQASFFSDDYDKLSELGERQAQVLGEYWLAQGDTFDEVYSGDLKRQVRTAEVVGETFEAAGQPWPEMKILPGLNEYAADAVMKAVLEEVAARDPRIKALDEAYRNATEDREKYVTFHRLLEAMMIVYVEGDYEAEVEETWEGFSGRVRGALHTILSAEGSGRRVAVFSSGGPIGVSVQTTLEAPEVKACELNWRVHNCSLTEFTFSSKRCTLDRFNNVTHLSDPELLTFR